MHQSLRYSLKLVLGVVLACASVSIVATASATELINTPRATDNPYYPHVTIVDAPQPEFILIAKNLPWNNAAVKVAGQLIAKQKSQYFNAIAKLKAAGATRIQVISEPVLLIGKPYRDAGQYVANLHPWHLAGFDGNGNLVGRSASFPTDSIDLANYASRPSKAECSMGEFVWFNPFTWFTSPDCKFTAATPSSYLRASLATAMKKATFSDESWILPELDFAMASSCPLTIKSDRLFCTALAAIFAGDLSIPLTKKSITGGYVITVDTNVRRATLTLVGPDQEALAKAARQEPGESFLRFF